MNISFGGVWWMNQYGFVFLLRTFVAKCLVICGNDVTLLA